MLRHLVQIVLPDGGTSHMMTDDVLFILSEHQEDVAVLSSAGIDVVLLWRV
jgi:hypothetical protein